MRQGLSLCGSSNRSLSPIRKGWLCWLEGNIEMTCAAAQVIPQVVPCQLANLKAQIVSAKAAMTSGLKATP
jgi:hypothetical protein